jgi:hypothetical protein
MPHPLFGAKDACYIGESVAKYIKLLGEVSLFVPRF